MLKNGRVYIYLSLSLIFVIYNFIFEMVFSNYEEAITESLVLLPMIFGFLILVYWSRKKIFGLNAVSEFVHKSLRNKNVFVIAIISLKSIIIATVSRFLSAIFLSTESESTYFDWLFLTILVSVLAVLIFIYFLEEYLSSIKSNHKMALELSEYKLEKSYAKYHALKKQLNPHFLFNSFNSLISLIPVSPIKAEKFVMELSNIYRYNLSQSDEVVVSLSDELNMIKSYIHLQKIRFGKALIYKELSKLDTTKFLIPPMTIQLLVENAIKHNSISKEHPLSIYIEIDNESILVSNNLQSKSQIYGKTESFGIGLSSIKNQLKLITDKNLEIINDDKEFLVIVPLIKTELDD
ncbi:MAG: histidine kinase [Bacteroidota bacterium]